MKNLQTVFHSGNINLTDLFQSDTTERMNWTEYQSTLPSKVQQGSFFSPPLCQHLISLVLPFFFVVVLIRVTYLIVLLICISLMISDSDHLLKYWLSMYMSSLEKYLFRFSTHFLKILNKLLEIILDSHVILRNKIERSFIFCFQFSEW